MPAVDEEPSVARRDPGNPSEPDEHLIARIADGDRASLVVLYQRWSRRLLAYLLTHTADHGVAEEILQDTMVAIWRDAGRFQARSQVSTWLFGVARRQAWNRLRRPGPGWVEPDALAHLPDDQAGPEQVVLARERVSQVAAAISRLAPTHREVLVLAFDGRLSYGELAQVLGIPVGTVRSRLSNAKRALQALVAAGGEEEV